MSTSQPLPTRPPPSSLSVGRPSLGERLPGACAPFVPVKPPSEEDIRRRAHERYRERGCTPGDPVEDWLQAEWELKLGLSAH
jgi:hypothetical protein